MAKKQQNNKPRIEYRINDEIDFYGSVRVIGEDIESSVIPMKEARVLAESLDLDIVEINPRTTPPIMRICNYEKMVYELKKSLKKHKPKQVLIAALFNKKPFRKLEVDVDFVGKEINDSLFLMGYGLDYNELDRNIPYVYCAQEEDIERMDVDRKR